MRAADLRGACFYGTDLSRANLKHANLSNATFELADIRGANFRSAILTGASFRGVITDDQTTSEIAFCRIITPAGELIGWKKLGNGTIIKLRIPASAKRVGGVVGRKCRASSAWVISGRGISERGGHYTPGKLVRPDRFDPNPLIECSHGIHFFLTRQEAEEYDFS